jgi:hypothetical protein
MITGAFPTEEKNRVQKYLNGKYVNEIFTAHMIPIGKRIRVEVTTTDGNKHYHNLKKKDCGNYEDYEIPMNDR